MDWRQLLRNKKAVAGLAAAGVLGLVVALRRNSGGGVDGDVPATSAGTGSGGVGSYDSTSTDVANQLGQFTNSVQNQLDQFQGQLEDALDALENVTPKTPGPSKPPGGGKKPLPVPPGKPRPTKPPTKKKPPAKKGRFYTIRKGDTLGEIADEKNISMRRLKALNPKLFDKDSRYGNLILPGQKVRLG